jgi:DNA-binding SARP family transcriptional activator
MKLLERSRSPIPASRRPVAPPPQRAFLSLLGGFELRVGPDAVVLPMRARRLLAFLAIRQRRLTRSHVSQSLWIDATERHADGSLRSALWNIGRLGTALVDTTGGHLSLAPGVAVDLHRSTRLAERLMNDGRALGESELDERMLRDDLLPDWYEEWVFPEREGYRNLRLHALERLCERLVALRSYSHAIDAGLAAVAAEPLRESANLVLIRAHIAEGNASEAVRHYGWYQRLLREEMSVAPSSAIAGVIERLREVVTPR